MTAPEVDAGRVIRDLEELARRTGGDAGAQRVAWTATWRAAREFLGELLGEIGLEAERDPAGNLWARLPGRSDEAIAFGSHLDSVPDGGWLDGALGVMAAVGVMRSWSEAGETPPRCLVLVDWADEEGARFGRSLFGSSAFAGSLDPAEVRGLRDRDGEPIADVLAANDVRLDEAPGASGRAAGLAGYLELHIEQGPVLESEGLATAAVEGCVGIERHRFTFQGQAAHAGTTPMDARHDAGLAAADAALRIEAVARRAGGMATTGVLNLRPGIPTAVAGEAELVADLRHPDADALTSLLAMARHELDEAAAERGCRIAAEPVWRIDPTRFDERLVKIAREASRDASGSDRLITSGALHDAAEVARVIPAAMIFCSSRRGLSHSPEEDTDRAHLAAGIRALGQAVAAAAGM